MSVVSPSEPRPLAVAVNYTAGAIGVSERTVHRLIAEGTLETVKIGRRRLVLMRSIDALLYQGGDDVRTA